MGRRQRQRDRQQRTTQVRTEAEEQAEELTAEAEELRADYDAEYAAYIESLNEDFERGEALDALGERPNRPPGQSAWKPEKEKGIVWQFKDGRKNNYHDYLYCKCRTCTRFREANDIKTWAEEHPGEPDPWDEDDLDWYTKTHQSNQGIGTPRRTYLGQGIGTRRCTNLPGG